MTSSFDRPVEEIVYGNGMGWHISSDGRRGFPDKDIGRFLPLRWSDGSLSTSFRWRVVHRFLNGNASHAILHLLFIGSEAM